MTALQPKEPPSVNAQSQIEVMRKALGDPSTSDDIKSYDLVWLIHLVGDVHQPMHAVARFTKPHRNGDAGGNLLTLSCKAPVSCAGNLHSQWGRAAGEQYNLRKCFDFGSPAGHQAEPERRRQHRR